MRERERERETQRERERERERKRDAERQRQNYFSYGNGILRVYPCLLHYATDQARQIRPLSPNQLLPAEFWP